MKPIKRILLSTIVFALTIPSVIVSAADEPNDLLLDQIQISDMTTNKVSQEDIWNFVSNASNVIAEERSHENNLLSSYEISNKSYQYIYLDDISNGNGTSYVYEEPGDGSAPILTLYNSDENGNTELLPMGSTAGQTDFIKDGVGGRVYITPSGPSSSYLSANLQLPQDQDVAPKVAAYNYMGFTTNIGYEADLGTVFVTTAGANANTKGWRMAFNMKYGGTKIASNLVSPYNEMWNKNAFKSASSVSIVNWYNYDKKARLKVTGTAICPTNACAQQVDTPMTAIMETGELGTTTPKAGIPSITKWKVLSTVVSNDNTGKNKGVFSNIKINDVAVPDASFATPEQDHALVTRSSNNITIDVDSNKYTLP